MKTIEEFRAYKLDGLGRMLEQPYAYGASEEVLWCWIEDMGFIDGQPDAWRTERDRLSAQRRSSNRGVGGVIGNLLTETLRRAPKPRWFTYEVVSVFAEVLWRLGYLPLKRQLAPIEWQSLNKSLRKIKKGSWHLADVVALLGEPSFTIGSRLTGTAVLCYASVDRETPWCFFDCDFVPQGYLTYEERTAFVDGKPWREHRDRENPLVKSIRYQGPANPKLFLTEYGRRIHDRD